MSSSQEQLALYDPVTVTTSTSSEPLEGIIAHLGPVQFASSTNEDDNNSYVGIRLTGSSVGHGQNDGSVQGVRYFDCGSASKGGKCGVFVKRHAVQRRELSRLEELRLKRELRSAGGTGSGSGAGTGSSAAGTSTSARSPKPASIADRKSVV